jgi:hypothetical protein
MAVSDETSIVTLPGSDPTAAELQTAIRSGNVDVVRFLMSENPDLATARFERRGSKLAPIPTPPPPQRPRRPLSTGPRAATTPTSPPH